MDDWMNRKPDRYEPIHRAIDGARYAEALSLARELRARFPNEDTTGINTATALIDAGGGLGDANLVGEGIDWFEAHAPRSVVPSTVREAILVYNLANGYATRQRLRRSQDKNRDPVALSDDPDTKLQKIYYQRVAHASFLVEPDLRARSLVNYGNLLHELGRFVESADQYEVALEARPNHPAALVNSAETLMDIAHLARPTFEAHCIALVIRLRRALRSGRVLVRSAGPNLRKMAEARLRSIEDMLARHGGLDIVGSRVMRSELEAKRAVPRPLQGLKWCARHGLYLSVNARLRRSPGYWKDDIEVAPLPAAQWPLQTTRGDLIERLNELRSDYAAARYLLLTGSSAPAALSKLARVSPWSQRSGAADWGRGCPSER
jgi:tetratricopeptide (TPR) repeat protein